MAEVAESHPVPRAFLIGTFTVAFVVAGLIIYLGINGYIGTWIPGSP